MDRKNRIAPLIVPKDVKALTQADYEGFLRQYAEVCDLASRYHSRTLRQEETISQKNKMILTLRNRIHEFKADGEIKSLNQQVAQLERLLCKLLDDNRQLEDDLRDARQEIHKQQMINLDMSKSTMAVIHPKCADPINVKVPATLESKGDWVWFE